MSKGTLRTCKKAREAGVQRVNTYLQDEACEEIGFEKEPYSL